MRDKVRIQIGYDVWETDIRTLPLMAQAILRVSSTEVQLDADEAELMEAQPEVTAG